jgi:hypothetical protein
MIKRNQHPFQWALIKLDPVSVTKYSNDADLNWRSCCDCSE